MASNATKSPVPVNNKTIFFWPCSNKWLNASAPVYAAISNATITVVVSAPAAYTDRGDVALQSFAGTNRLVWFILSEVNGGTTNCLQTND